VIVWQGLDKAANERAARNALDFKKLAPQRQAIEEKRAID
jgi:hypothetical protein